MIDLYKQLTLIEYCALSDADQKLWCDHAMQRYDEEQTAKAVARYKRKRDRANQTV